MNSVHPQLSFSYTMAQLLPQLLSSTDQLARTGVDGGDNVQCVGKARKIVLTAGITAQLGTSVGNVGDKSYKFDRCRSKNILFTSSNRVTMRDSSSVMYHSQQGFCFGEISYFLKLSDKTFAVVYPYSLLGSCKHFLNLSHDSLNNIVFPVSLTNSSIVIPIGHLITKLVHIIINDSVSVFNFVIVPPNNITSD